jgi:hypothetical protein
MTMRTWLYLLFLASLGLLLICIDLGRWLFSKFRYPTNPFVWARS